MDFPKHLVYTGNTLVLEPVNNSIRSMEQWLLSKQWKIVLNGLPNNRNGCLLGDVLMIPILQSGLPFNQPERL